MYDNRETNTVPVEVNIKRSGIKKAKGGAARVSQKQRMFTKNRRVKKKERNTIKKKAKEAYIDW